MHRSCQFVRLFVTILFCFLVTFSVLALSSSAQLTNVSSDQATPIPGAGHDYIRMLSETVNPASGSISLRIQTPVPSGRGLRIPFTFSYDSNGLRHLQTDDAGEPRWSQDYPALNPYLTRGGWSYSLPMLSYTIGYRTTSGGGHSSSCGFVSSYMFEDPAAGQHALGLSIAQQSNAGTCTSPTGYSILTAGDDLFRASTSGAWGSNITTTVADADGTVYHFAGSYLTVGLLPSYIEDRNGNKVVVTNNGQGTFAFTDTLGRLVLSSSSFASPSGDSINISGLSSYRVIWKTVSSNFTTTVQITPGDYCPAIPSDTQQRSVISNISLPNGQAYSFLYGTDDPNNSNPYGLLSKITYPSGGWVKYTYGINALSEYFSSTITNTNPASLCAFLYGRPAVTQRTVSFDGTNVALQQNFSYSTTWNNSTYPSIWTTKQTTVTDHDLVTGQVTEKDYVYSPFSVGYPPNVGAGGSQTAVEQSITRKDANGHILQTVSKVWQDPYLLTQQQTTLDNGSSSKVTFSYGTGGQRTKMDEYDFGQSAPSRITKTTYQVFPNTPIYTNGASIFDRPCRVVVYDGTGTNVFAETDTLYDGGTTVCGTPGTSSVASVSNLPSGTHDEANYGTATNPPRGNATSITRICMQSCSNATTVLTYDETGQTLSRKDPIGNTTYYSYADNFDTVPPASTNAYLTKITYPVTNGVNHIKQFKYAYTDGQVITSTDENNQVTSYFYADPLRRLTETDYADTGKTTESYNDAPPAPTVTSARLMNSPSSFISSMIVKDGIGHVTQSQPIRGVNYVDTTYDGESNVRTRSNPHGTSTLPTDGTTTYSYDALGRLTQTTQPDGSKTTTTYSGPCSTYKDEAGKSGKSCTDGLERLVQVFEDPNASNYETDYTYNVLNDLLTVNQKGGSTNSASWRTRTFSYDSLSELRTASNPESGSVTYTYDNDGNVHTKVAPLPNQTGAATVTTTYAYDALNRLTSKTYSDGTPTATFTYDLSSTAGLTGLANPIGRLVQASNSSAQTVNSYDPMGRIKQQWQCTPINCGTQGWFTFAYTYNLVGEQTSIYSQGFGCQSNCTPGLYTLTQSYDSVGRVIALTSSLTDLPLHPPTLVSGVTYNPAGQITAMTYGNNLTETRAYNNRLQTCHLNLNSSGGTLASCTSATPVGNIQDFVYHYNLNVADNGNITWTTGTGQQSFYRTYTYDSLNRLYTMADSDPSQVCKGLSWTYDPWGNRTAQSVTAGACGTFSVGVSMNNQFVGSPYQYDAAGNMIHDASHSYSYDAEGHITKVDGGSTATYVYDVNSRRIEQLTPHGGFAGALQIHFWYDTDGRIRTTWDQNGQWMDDHLYLAGEYIGFYSTLYVFKDILGSTRILTMPDKTVRDSYDFLPFGEQEIGSTWAPFKFTGKEHDVESGLDNFGARYNSSSMGRFMSPDPGNAGVIDEDPQTWNAYSYVRNNPLRYADPDGLRVQICDTSGHCTEISDAEFKNDFADANNVKLVRDQIFIKNDKGDFQLAGTAQRSSFEGPQGIESADVTNMLMVSPFAGLIAGGLSAAEGAAGAEAIGASTGAAGAAGSEAAASGSQQVIQLTVHAAKRAAAKGISQGEVDTAVQTAKATGNFIQQIGKYGTPQNVYEGSNGVTVAVETMGRNAGKAISVWLTGSK